ncbi:hypothetical protein N9544_04940 [Flavobacteriales bacterium]|nr:hypothetical protein [Flavobacteriales bacterium]
MKYISERISFHRHDEYTTILISTKVDKWKESLLYGWLMLWVLVGIAITYVLITGNYLTEATENTSKNQLQLFLIIFLVFWAYYLYKIIRVYTWRKKGVEYFKLNKDALVIKRAFGKIGKAHSYLYSNMEPIKILEQKERSYSSVMQSAFWDIGNERLSFEYHGKSIIFGLQLESIESKKLKEFLNSEIKKQKAKKH